MESILHQTVRELAEFLIDIAQGTPAYGELLALQTFIEHIPIDRLMDSIIEFVLPHKKAISERDDKFFLEDRVIFANLPEDSVDCFKHVWNSPAMNEQEDKEAVFAYFDSMIACAEAHLRRRLRKKNE